MNSKSRSTCGILIAIAATLASNHSMLQAALYRVDASVVATFTQGPVSTATGSFAFLFDNSFLNGASSGERNNWPVTQFQTSLNPIGPTTFSPSNVEGYVFYNQGSLRQVLVGGVGSNILDENRIGGNSNDFFITLSLKANGQLDNTFPWSAGEFAYANMNPFLTIFTGTIDTSASSVTVTLVPEPAVIVLCLVGILSVAFTRPRRSVPHNRV